MNADRPDRTVLITGATGTLGSAIATAFADAGCLVGVHYNTRDDAARALREEIRARGGDAVLLRADLRDAAAAEALVEQFSAEVERPIDCLVNNAGGNDDRLLHYLEAEQWNDTLALNLQAVYLVTRKVLPGMIRERRGAIIHVSSVAALKGLPGQTAYAAAKAGVHGFTRALAREVGRFNIRVNAVAPGAIESRSVSSLPPDRRAWLEESSCLARLGRPGEVADVVVYLASERASFITSQVIVVDGGLV